MITELQGMKPDTNARKCEAFHAALESFLSDSAQGRTAAESNLWAAYGTYRDCYDYYAPSFIPPLRTNMTHSLATYYIYRKKLHDFLVGTHDDTAAAAAATEVHAAKKLHHASYMDYLSAKNRDTAAWFEAVSAKLRGRKPCTARLISDYPDTHQLAAACERINGMVRIPVEIREALCMGAMEHNGDVRSVEHEFELLYMRIIEKQTIGEQRDARPLCVERPPTRPCSRGDRVTGAISSAPRASVTSGTSCTVHHERNRCLSSISHQRRHHRSRSRHRGASYRVSSHRGSLRSRTRHECERPLRRRRSRSHRRRSFGQKHCPAEERAPSSRRPSRLVHMTSRSFPGRQAWRAAAKVGAKGTTRE